MQAQKRFAIPEITDEQNNFLGCIGKVIMAVSAIYVFGWGVFEFKVSQERQFYFELFKHKQRTLIDLVGYTSYLASTDHRSTEYDSIYMAYNRFRPTAMVEIDDDSLTHSVATFNSCLELYVRGSRDMTMDDLIPYKNDVNRRAQTTLHNLTKINNHEQSSSPSFLYRLYGWL